MKALIKRIRSVLFSKASAFFILIFLVLFLGNRYQYSYFHFADPLILMASLMLPTFSAIMATGLAGIAVDLIRASYFNIPVALIIHIGMVLAVKGLIRLPAAAKHKELLAAPAALVPIVGYFFGEWILELILDAETPFRAAVGTLTKTSVQAAVSVLIFFLLYDIIKSYSAARAQIKKQEQESTTEEGNNQDE